MKDFCEYVFPIVAGVLLFIGLIWLIVFIVLKSIPTDEESARRLRFYQEQAVQEIKLCQDNNLIAEKSKSNGHYYCKPKE